MTYKMKRAGKTVMFALPISLAIALCYNVMFGAGIGMIAFAIAYSALSEKKK